MSLHRASETSAGAITAPVFYLQCPGIPDEARLYNSILLKLCKKFRPSVPPQEKLVLTLDALSKIDLRILTLDEVNFTEAGTAAKQKRFLNALRFLANELQICIVCLGTEEMMRVIRTVPSVENRFVPTVLPRWQSNQEFRASSATRPLATRVDLALAAEFIACAGWEPADWHPGRRRMFSRQQ